MMGFKNRSKSASSTFSSKAQSYKLVDFFLVIVQNSIYERVFDQVLGDLLLTRHDAAITIRLATHLIGLFRNF